LLAGSPFNKAVVANEATMKHSVRFLAIALLLCSVLVSTSVFAATRGIHVVSKQGQSLYLYKDYHALVVGVGNYNRGWPDLPGAVRDTREVASSLQEMGFTVKLILNPTSSQLKSALNDMAFDTGTRKDRALLFFFAGHGETLELADGTELGYIIPTDCPLKSQDPRGFDDKAVSMRDIEDLALKVKSKHVLMMFDSCFSGSLFGLVRAAPVDISEKSSRAVRQFITAGEAGEQVPDRSIFKIVFLDGIKGDADLNSDGYITGSELGMHLQDKVVNYTRGGQHPQYGKINNPKLDKGDFIFVPGKPYQPVLPSVVNSPLQPVPPPPQPELSQEFDLGTIRYTEAPRTWTVHLPPNFERVELGVYAKGKPSVSMYGGWNAYLKINRRYVWKFLRFQKGAGGIIRDYFLDETVQESSGRNRYINVTKLMQPGPNTIQYYHHTEGDGMGLKMRIYLNEN